MPVQIGNGRGGYDPSLTIAEQIADVVEHIERRRQVALEPARTAVAVAQAQFDEAMAAWNKETPQGAAALVEALAQATAVLNAAEAELAKQEALPAAALEGSAAMNNLIQRLADLKTLAA